eukprot:3308519-Pyramimonas_sp.AAC.1
MWDAYCLCHRQDTAGDAPAAAAAERQQGGAAAAASAAVASGDAAEETVSTMHPNADIRLATFTHHT